MAQGGGSVLLEANKRWLGPGGESAFQQAGQEDILVFHAYDAVSGKPSMSLATTFQVQKELEAKTFPKRSGSVRLLVSVIAGAMAHPLPAAGAPASAWLTYQCARLRSSLAK